MSIPLSSYNGFKSTALTRYLPLKISFFKRYVTNVSILLYSNRDTLKLQPYWNACNLTDHHDNISAPAESAWADDILGLNICSSHADKRPLDVEVDAYLLDSQFSTTTLNFWQVCHNFYYFCYDDISITGIGKSASFSNYFCLCCRHFTYSSIGCTLRTSILICKGDNDSSTQQAQPRAYGSTSSSQIFY